VIDASWPFRASRGIVILGGLILLSSASHILKLVLDRDWYFETYGYLPAFWMFARYGVSWLQRLIGIGIAIGLLRCHELARRAAIVLGIFSMAVGPWKHPVTGFEAHARFLDRHFGHWFGRAGYPEITFISMARAAAACQWLLDILFWTLTIYFLTRPAVIRQFRKTS
jgi:hypothetical protein